MTHSNNGQLVEFGEVVTYYPVPGYHFATDYDLQEWGVECLRTGRYNLDLHAMIALDSE